MKLVTYRHEGVRIGAVKGDGIVDLSDRHLARDMVTLIAHWHDVKDHAEHIVANETPHIMLKDVELLAPVPRPQKVMAIGLN